MTTLLLDRARVDEITRQAHEVHPVRTVLTWIAAILFGIGWVAYKTVAVLWFALAWTFVAIREGWRAAKASNGPARSD